MYKTPGEREIADPRVKARPEGILANARIARTFGAIAPVPQTYAGVRFRSTLEADWAATLDQAGLTWSYEPEAVCLQSGTLYRPDFWLPQLECWLEVKGPGIPGREKAFELSRIAWVIIGEAPIRGMTTWWLHDPPGYWGIADGGAPCRTGEGPSWVEKYDQVVNVLGRGHADFSNNVPFARAARPT